MKMEEPDESCAPQVEKSRGRQRSSLTIRSQVPQFHPTLCFIISSIVSLKSPTLQALRALRPSLGPQPCTQKVLYWISDHSI